MIVQCCLNGTRPPGWHPRLPVSVEAIVAEAVEAVRAGAAELHLHVRDTDGAETLAAEPVDATVAALRAALPGTVFGISTGAWIERDEERRLACIASWRVLPDHASVNLAEPGAPAVIELLHRRGIAIEAGLASVADAERLIRLGLAPLALRILVEIDRPQRDVALGEAEAIRATLARAGISRAVLLHGFDGTVWPFVEHAARHRLSTRVGLEDGRILPDGSDALSNAQLVAAAVAMLRR